MSPGPYATGLTAAGGISDGGGGDFRRHRFSWRKQILGERPLHCVACPSFSYPFLISLLLPGFTSVLLLFLFSISLDSPICPSLWSTRRWAAFFPKHVRCQDAACSLSGCSTSAASQAHSNVNLRTKCLKVDPSSFKVIFRSCLATATKR